MRTRGPRAREEGSILSRVRDLVILDLRVTRSSFDHLRPEVRDFLCAPAVLALAVLDWFLGPRAF